jgi:pimeloyl-ACP methyl ester carboxylesterase
VTGAPVQRPDGERPVVVLLHGLARTRHSMAGLARHLTRAGFVTWSRSYPSRRLSIAAAAEVVAGWIARELPAAQPLAAVTHSLGGILVRHMAARIPFARVVMLAPPNQGSRLSRALRDRAFFQWLCGPAGQEIAAAGDGEAWPALAAATAVIAGTRARLGWNPTGWLSRSLGAFAADEPNDGTLAVAETRLPGMSAFATVDASHTWIMDHPAARALIVRFLETGGAL